MKYILGLDVGIGSIGWAVIRNDEIKRIENFGVRLFASGEDSKTKDRKSQKRRAYRSSRRVFRRRSHRKWRIKAHLENIGLCSISDINKYFENASPNIIELRVKALDEKVSPEELAACLINICNRRGYKAFYEQATDEMTNEEKKEFEEDNEAIGVTLKLMEDGGYRTVAEMIQKDDFFCNDASEFRRYRNNGYTDKKILFTRNMFQDEVIKILEKQREFYAQLNQNNIDYIIDAIFSQRDFEDGPGNPDDKYRKYTGFLDSMGNCSFYKNEKRGSRYTLIADVYTLTNVLSQYIYINTRTGEIGLPPELAIELIDFTLKNGKISTTDINKIAKKYDIQIKSESDTKISECFKFIKSVKKDFEDCGYDWSQLVKNYTDENSLLNRIGIFLSENITPKRRCKKIANEFPELDEKLIEKLVTKKPSGMSRVCYKFMRESIEAFQRGESYGSFQANFNKEKSKIEESDAKHFKILPPFKEDYEFYDNPVVFRAINETRKIINGVVRKYGSPYAVNIEVGTELNKSLENRSKEDKQNKANEKATKEIIKKIAELLRVDENTVTPSQIERYKLGEEQGWTCLYSGKEITDKKEAILNTNHIFEVDHIVPFSLILDNTLSNKALVYYAENQTKGQRTPLMYLKKEAAEKFISKVNLLYGKKKEFRRKYQYLMLKSLDDEELLKEWKSRNINDTRYISKFLVNYIRNNLEFARADDGEKYQRQTVYGVKSAITSRLRRQWLNRETWGNYNKADLKSVTCLDHAVDAIVIANCIPAYVEMAALNQKLKDIFHSSGRLETDEYNDVLNTAIDNLYKFYGIPRKVSEPLLRYKNNTPSLIPNLREEVEIRVCDCFMERHFILEKERKKVRKNIFKIIGSDNSEESKDIQKNAFKKLDDANTFEKIQQINDENIQKNKDIRGQINIDENELEKINNSGELPSDELIIENFRKNVDRFYSYDPEFAAKIQMPLFSLKQDKKINKKIFADNPLSIKTIDGTDYQITTKSVLSLKKKDIRNLYTGDVKLIETLTELMTKYKDDDTVEKALKAKGEERFIYSGRQLNKVKVKSAAPKRYFVKEISEGNQTVLDNTNYYCIDIYENKKGKKNVCAVSYSDLVKSGSKIYLKADYKYPDDYAKHSLYVFPGDYIRIERGKEIIEGYYRGVKDINRNEIYYTVGNKTKYDKIGITQNAIITKYDINILGNKGGAVKCGEPLSLITEKK